jgi:predicted Zn-dependent protease
MPSVNPFERTILAAQGYYDLQMPEDAIAELDTLPLSAQLRADVLEMRVVILIKAQRWCEALDTSEKLCAVAPDSPTGFIHLAFSMHELGRTRQAKEVLLDGPTSLAREPTFHYNMACYECALGNIEVAKAYLDASLSMDKKLRAYAKEDPDLKPLNL